MIGVATTEPRHRQLGLTDGEYELIAQKLGREPNEVELEVDDPSQLPAMCEKLLANPLIEDYEVQLLEGERGNGGDPAR